MRHSLSFYRAEIGLRNGGNIVALGGDDAAPRRSHDPWQSFLAGKGTSTQQWVERSGDLCMECDRNAGVLPNE